MGSGNWPNFQGLIASQWPNGWDDGFGGLFAGGASNIVVGTNPPFAATDFFTFYPKFGGNPLGVTGTLTSGSPLVTSISPGVTSLQANSLIIGTGIPGGTTIVTVTGPSTFTMSQNATASGTGIAISMFVAPIVPLVVVNAYIALASASLVQARYLEMWSLVMNLYVAHFVTLWIRSDGDIYSTPGQAAAAGFARGITISKGAGPVSQGIQQATGGSESWGQWTQTEYGVQFCQIARLNGMGAMLVW